MVRESENIKKSKRDSDDEVTFRGSLGIVAGRKPLGLALKQEWYLSPGNPVDMYLKDSLEKRGFEFEETGKDSVIKAIVTPEKKEIDLGELIDLPFKHPSPENIIEEMFAQYSNKGAGILPVSRVFQGIQYDQLRPEAFKQDMETPFIELENDLKNNKSLSIGEQELSLFGKGLEKRGYIRRKPEGGIERLIPLKELYGNPKEAIDFYLEHYLSLLEKFLPTSKFERIKEQSVQWFNEDSTTALQYFIPTDDNGKPKKDEKPYWKAQGLWYVTQEKDGSKHLHYRDMSSNGCWIIKDKTSIDDEIVSLERQVKFDRTDETIRAGNKGDVDEAHNFIRELDDKKVLIQMTRSKKRGFSPIYDVDLGVLGKPIHAHIHIGLGYPDQEVAGISPPLPRNIMEVYSK